MKFTNIGYVAKMNKRRSKKGLNRLWVAGARCSSKSNTDLERVRALLNNRNGRNCP